ncbi:alpha/beta fold hydrolase [Roseomonas terrae]|uniref:Alpha/beta fold hydrolase n=1 Tax=Neoroseomonas terrae TaxID=424799 RepID=A0ABS5EGL8_9PROT|nr:alpha/beta fold hydrolase [Neoroseomonas terrae]
MSDDRFFSGTRLRTRYRLHGEGRPVVLIHGVGSDLEDLSLVAGALGTGFRILRPDLRGHGQSERVPGPYVLEDFTDDISEMMEHVGFTSADIMGFSLGALIAQRFALDHPDRVRRLALVSGVAGRTGAEREAVLKRLAALERDEPMSHATASASRWFTDAFRESHPDVVESRLARIAANHKPSYAAAYRVLATSDLADALHRIAVPTLVMTGEFDQGSNPRMARLMHERIAGSELQILPGLRHSILLEAPDVVAGHLREFLTRPDAPPSGRRAALAAALFGLLAAPAVAQGSGTHIASEMLWRTLAIEMLHVPYRGTAPALNDLLAGRLDVMFTTISSVASQVRSNAVKAVGVSGAQRSPLLPEVATIAEQGFPGYEFSNWAAIVAPARTPRPILDRVAAAVTQAMRTPAVRERLASEGVVGDPEGPDAAAQLYRAEVARWTPLLREMQVEMN